MSLYMEGQHKGTCSGCPFNVGYSEEADQIQDYGCLPTYAEIVTKFDKEGKVWACHSKPHKTCTGLKNTRPEAKKLNPTVGETFGEW
jgi:hypothetical protein